MTPSQNDATPLAVIAIGGNSLIKDRSQPQVHHQWDAVRETAGHIANMIQAGWRAVITHGNGPQVGFILRRNELAMHEVHTTPLDVIVADTQGSIGYMLQQALNNEFYQRGIERQCVTIVTQVRVDANDPAFQHPTKPIGGFLDEAAAARFAAEGWPVIEDAGRGWRRVVASPKPQEIIEIEAIRQAVAAGWIVIAVGGGGIPVARNRRGELRGVPAVIDKDLASGLLASQLQADLFLISTGVEKVMLYFGQPQERPLDRMNREEARRYLAEGHFAPGSMRPKIEACLAFLDQAPHSDAYALITNPENLERALHGETGTRLVR
ncbi:carbamate kinase [Litorilinea aerophila]|uniref:Carbamate kinase n=1 Tax=Litorilinea aerophila TaxID=1204385 RepID=A0A540VD40_9CHLR|nr:carbamate kinase [Litorilinea aerophila]MCC9077540.1 carbamate kinase [Litorilinea aerophila]GIV79379.1 MAG: carbamate kinase [Litorilinea sp.]